MEEKKKSIKKITKGLYVLSCILFSILVVVGIGMLIYASAFFYKNNTILDALSFNNQMGLKDINKLYEYSTGVHIAYFGLIFLQIGLMIYVLCNACFIFKNISFDGIPFKLIIATKIHSIAVVSIIYNLIPTMTFDESKLSSSVRVGKQGIIFAVIFLGIAKVFEYGCILQQESDETL